MKPIQIIEGLLPYLILWEIAGILERGSHKEGSGVLTCDRPWFYYFYKFWKHLVRWLIGVLLMNRWKYDNDSGRSHLAHAIVRLMQVLGVDLGVR